MEKGKIIVIGGADGTGKETTVRLLHERINAEKPFGVATHKASFPNYDEYFGKLIRAHLDGDNAENLVRMPKRYRDDPIVVGALYALDRYTAFTDKLSPILRSGSWLILDRYYESNLVYQPLKAGPENRKELIERLLMLEHGVNMIPKPDFTAILDLPETVRSQRVAARRTAGTDNRKVGATDIYEQDDAFMAEVAKQYRMLARQFNWKVINVAPDGVNQLPPEEVADLVLKEILKKFEKLRT